MKAHRPTPICPRVPRLFQAHVVLVFAVLLSVSLGRTHADWPQFRGPDGDGRSGATGLPLKWSEKENVKWKTALHGRAWSSPVILGNQIWLSTATEDGKELSAICVDRDSGKIVRDLKLFEVETPQFAHKFNSYASPTPVIEPGRVYVTFGSPGTACLDTETGKVLWERRDFECDHFRGAGSSPILHGDLLIMQFDGSDHQYIVALDKKTGKTVWRADRSIDFQDLDADGKPKAEGDFRKAFATPHVAMFNGQPLLISIGANAAYGYEPLTGKELWRIEERSNHSASTRPVVGHGLIFYPTGFANAQLLAVQPDGRGHVTDTHVVWRVRRSVPNKPSLVLKDDLLFMIADGGMATCLEATSGAEVWSERVGGNYSASPALAEGRIYFFSEEGKTTVINASRDFQKIAESTLEDGFMASPAIAGKAFFLRTKTHLYRVEE
jgi:outer membrane protein assembly factor BamB